MTTDLDAGHIRWLRRRLKSFRRVRNGEVFFEMCNLEELCRQVDEIPEFFIEDLDAAYREGFEEGFDHAIEAVRELHSRYGFVRVREVFNILWEWSASVLEIWKWKGRGKHLNPLLHHPVFRQKETWAQIRVRIIKRDGRCVRCGHVGKFEIDHIQEVQEGGLPVDSNLRTLCVPCHQEKRVWSKAKSLRDGNL